MGRVARYKKIRKCDPFAKGGGVMVTTWGLGNDGRKVKKRSRTSQMLRAKRAQNMSGPITPKVTGFDLPPGRDEFDMSDLLGSIKKQKVPKNLLEDNEKQSHVLLATTTVKLSVPETTQDAVKAVAQDTRDFKSVLKINADQTKKEQELVQRMEGESKKAFRRRLKQETRQIIRNEKVDSHNQEKKQRKKEFLNDKKKKKKSRSAPDIDDANDDFHNYRPSGNDDTFITGEQAAKAIAFGEQVERPPVFLQLPRGATVKKRRNMKDLSRGEQQIETEQRTMEKLRQQVQAQYAVMRSKRNQDREFHL